TPVRLQQKELSRKPPFGPWTVIQDFQTEWAKQSGVWVPIRHEFAITPPKPKSQRHEVFEITWERINKHVDYSVFDYNSVHVPDSVGVLDYSTGEPIELKSAVKSIPQIVGLPPAPQQTSQVWTRIAIGVGVAGLGFIIFFARWYPSPHLPLRSQEDSVTGPTDSYTSQAATPGN